jgi:hypothetical protein
MVSPLELADRRYRSGVKLQHTTTRAALSLWRGVDGSHIDASWLRIAPLLLALVTRAQEQAAAGSDAYVAAALSAQGLDSDALGAVVPTALAGVASDGRELSTLLQSPVIAAKTLIGQGASTAKALQSGRFVLGMIVGTQVADAGRVADGMATVSRPRAQGYVRMLSTPSCSRCIILAGRFYRWSAGFDRHPLCDCRHIPASEDTADNLTTDPKAYFASLSREEQDKAFTQAGAQAIRDGADINQVVNARRGARGLNAAAGRRTAEEARALRNGRDRGSLQTERVYGRDAFITTEGTTSRGLAGRRLQELQKQDGQRYRRSRTPRLMPEQIYRDATSREDAIRLLRRFGYII